MRISFSSDLLNFLVFDLAGFGFCPTIIFLYVSLSNSPILAAAPAEAVDPRFEDVDRERAVVDPDDSSEASSFFLSPSSIFLFPDSFFFLGRFVGAGLGGAGGTKTPLSSKDVSLRCRAAVSFDFLAPRDDVAAAAFEEDADDVDGASSVVFILLISGSSPSSSGNAVGVGRRRGEATSGADARDFVSAVVVVAVAVAETSGGVGFNRMNEKERR